MKFRHLAVRAAGISIAMLGAVSVHAAGDASKATQTATQVCAACHGADGNSAIGMYPSLAGQHPEYIAKQLDNFKSGERKNAIMAGMAAPLTAEEMANLGAYFAAQAPKGATANSNGPGSLGEKIYRAGVPGIGVPACASCHGPAGAGIPVQFPRLGGCHQCTASLGFVIGSSAIRRSGSSFIPLACVLDVLAPGGEDWLSHGRRRRAVVYSGAVCH